MRILVLIAAVAMNTAAASYDPWVVDSIDNPGDTMAVDPSSAALEGNGKVKVDFDYFQNGKHVTRRTLSVTGCNRQSGTIALIDDDADFGLQHWVAAGNRSYDLLSVRACNAARLKQESGT
jgi:hypothetical protein